MLCLKNEKRKSMKTARLLIILGAFLIMISSVFSLMTTTDRTPVYINIFAMLSLAIAVSVMNFQKNNKKDRR